MKVLMTLLAAALLTGCASTTVQTKIVEYRHDGVVLEGYLAWNSHAKGPRPGVLVVHEWYGLNDYARMRSRQLARLGYVVFAADMYGKGKRARNRKEAGKLAGAVRANRPLMRARAKAALEVLQGQALCNGRTAAIGYCFGGGCVLELARSGAAVDGVVSFHGNLDTPNPDDAKAIKARVLVLHGADDPHVKPAQVLAFEAEMHKAGVDWQLNAYGGAVHAFSNPKAGNDPTRGAAYNAAADRRSWAAMRLFFDEIFAR